MEDTNSYTKKVMVVLDLEEMDKIKKQSVYKESFSATVRRLAIERCNHLEKENGEDDGREEKDS